MTRIYRSKSSVLKERNYRLYEADRTRFINKNPNLSDKQKLFLIDYFSRYPENDVDIKWDSKEVKNMNFIDFFKHIEFNTEKENKNLSRIISKFSGIDAIEEGRDYLIVEDNEHYTSYYPITHKGSRVLASNMVEPKLWCESSVMDWTVKEILPCIKEKDLPKVCKDGLMPGAKWCISMETDENWNIYKNRGAEFLIVCYKDHNLDDESKKKCFVYLRGERIDYECVNAADRDFFGFTPLDNMACREFEDKLFEIYEYVKKAKKDSKKEQLDSLYYNKTTGRYDIPKNANININDLVVDNEIFIPIGVWEGDFYVNYSLKPSKNFPLKVIGHFDCSFNRLITSLKGWCPTYVGGDFTCQCCHNLTSLEGCPTYVGGDFTCQCCHNLTSLKGCPSEVGGSFDCSDCYNLSSLEGCPTEIEGDFNCGWCISLKTLKGCPTEVDGFFSCNSCDDLTSLEGAPEYVGEFFDCSECDNLVSLKGAPYRTGNFLCWGNESLESLEGAPKEVVGHFNCELNASLISLDGCPNKVYGDFNCSRCELLVDYSALDDCFISGEIVK